jgi:basic membrane protein A and related proteins
LRKHLWRWAVVAIAALGLSVLAAGCGGGGEEKAQTTTAGGGTGTAGGGGGGGKAIKVGLVTDIGGLNDKSFNHLAYLGLQRAQDQLGVTGKVLESHANSDYIPNLSSLAQQKYDLVIGVGFLMADAIDTVGTKFPDVNFAIIDFPNVALKHKPKNVRGLVFKEQEAGYLVGYLAGLVEKQESGSQNTVASVGGQKIPPVDHYIAGYQFGAKQADPGIKTLNGYSQDFVDQAKCKEIALNQLSQGAGVVFQVAGGCGLGALDAAKEKNVWGIGVDADQAYLGSHVLTSALKKVDVAVFDTIKSAQDGSFSGGSDTVFDAKNEGVGIGKISSKVPQDIVSKVRAQEQKLANGQITGIPDTVK